MLTYELMVYHCSKGYCAVLPPELKMLESHYQQQVCFSDGLPGELLSGTERDNVIFRGRVVLEQVLNCARFDDFELPEPIKWSECRNTQSQIEFIPVAYLQKGTIQIYEGRHVRFYHNSNRRCSIGKGRALSRLIGHITLLSLEMRFSGSAMTGQPNTFSGG